MVPPLFSGGHPSVFPSLPLFFSPPSGPGFLQLLTGLSICLFILLFHSLDSVTFVIPLSILQVYVFLLRRFRSFSLWISTCNRASKSTRLAVDHLNLILL